MSANPNRTDIRNRLAGYWKLELANAVMIPALAIFLTSTSHSELGWLSWLSFVPMSGLLVVGGLYWRGKLDALEGRAARLGRVLAQADRWQVPLAILSGAAFLAAIASWLDPGLSVSLADRITASVCSTLAVLEYVNYYHRQLQHFDHLADFRRLLAGRGFRPAQMAVDLRRFRAGMVK
ncbi:hypothetical protein K3152_04660 [Qipengyuania sp. 1NDH17]|uniref:Uncharacterized protein n=1 Tax=Qipengyuania polymorpha TaxID=2867234 RepID=A0ABS7IVM8_9SPHN|nr:hypothetical protein [Qipengyuania polymorpha]MBX7457532.1 hypothetical protein [Qipengyuania polymorpha]